MQGLIGNRGRLNDFKHKPLAETKLFWFAFLGPIILGVMFGVVVWLAESPLQWCMRSVCVQTFFSIYKFPIAVASCSLPIVAMVAAIHRSNEASLQISYASLQYGEAIKNNRFGNYLKHREGFDKIAVGICSHASKQFVSKLVIDSPLLYGNIFNKSGFGSLDWNGECDPDWLEASEKTAKGIVSEARKTGGDFDLVKFLHLIRDLQFRLKISYWPFQSIAYDLGGTSCSIGVADYDTDHVAIVYAALDALSVLAVIRSYVGRHSYGEFLLDARYEDVVAAVSMNKHRYTSTRFTKVFNRAG